MGNAASNDGAYDYLDQMNAAQLKALCKERGLKASGKKSELQERLREYFLNPEAQQQPKDEYGIENMKVSELKALCVEKGLQNTGKKAELQERLREHFASLTQPSSETTVSGDGIDSMPEEDLRDALIGRGIFPPQGCTRQELIKLYREDELYALQLMKSAAPDSSADFASLSALLEKEDGVLADFIKNQQEKEAPKYVDVKVTSLGLAPEKYTTGGAPSVTADVIKKLAGNPFADPPKYGTVSIKGALVTDFADCIFAHNFHFTTGV